MLATGQRRGSGRTAVDYPDSPEKAAENVQSALSLMEEMGMAQFALDEPLVKLIAPSSEAFYVVKNTGRNRVASDDEVVGPTVAART